ncbi:assimilatory sulfite reductase [Gautieria morchelliformis]|nr:assimilatory sulfite reductase [Gautieria morchelliformis]
MALSNFKVTSSKTKLAADLLVSFHSQSHSSDVAASSVIEWLASRLSSTVFSYDLAEDSGFGALTREWAATDPKAAKLVSLQTRTGAGLTLAGRLSEGTSKDAHTGMALTAYTTPDGLAQMAPALALLTQPTASSRLVIQMASVTSVGPDLILSPTLAPAFSALFSLPVSFAVFLSSTPQEAVELASLAYYLPQNHVVHVFDHYSSARETTHIVRPSQTFRPGMSVHDAFLDLGYGFFDYAGDNEAHTVVVLLNGPLATAAKTLASQIAGFGVLVVRVLRPWSEEAFRMALPSTVKTVHVMDDVPSEATQGGLFVDVFASLFDPSSPSSPTIQTHRNTPQRTHQYLSSATRFSSFFFSLLPPNSPVSPIVPTVPTSKKILFFSTVNTSTADLPLYITRTFLSHRAIKTRHLRDSDAFSKPGGIMADRVLLSAKSDLDDHMPVQFLLPLDPSTPEGTEGAADFVGVLDQTLLKSHSILKYARRGAPVLISTTWSPDEFLANTPRRTLALIREQDLRIYIFDPTGIASELPLNVDSSTRNIAEIVFGYLMFMRLYVGSAGGDGRAALEQLARSSLGSAIAGIDISIVCSKAWDALQSVTIPVTWSKDDNLDDPEVKAVSLEEFEFNTVELEDSALAPGTDMPRVSAWHDAAKHIIFREAFSPPCSAQEEAYPQDPALRPDLPERTFLVTTSANRRLTPKEYDRNVFHLEFDTKGTGLKYAIGEALGVHGWNDSGDVLEFCGWYGVDPEQLITIPAPGRGNGKEKLVHTRTVFQALQQQVDIFGRPPKSFYGALSTYAQLRTEQMALHFISSAEGSSTFKQLAEKNTVTFADVLKMYSSARPSIAELCGLVGDISPRHYSIASSQAAVGDRVDLLVVTVDWVTPSGLPRYGQCTRYLADLKVGQQVTVSIKPSVMKLPPNPMQPIIMAGLGTGAAPFRAFMQYRAWLAEQNVPVGPLLYYFGSRHRSQEYLYGEEIEAFIEDKVITHSGLAFSRDGKKKVYIQHKMKEDAEMLVRHLSAEDGVFYLCGPTWPVPDVYEALVGALVQYVGKTVEEAAEYLEGLKEEERYVLEVY